MGLSQLGHPLHRLFEVGPSPETPGDEFGYGFQRGIPDAPESLQRIS